MKLPAWHLRSEHEMHRLAREAESGTITLTPTGGKFSLSHIRGAAEFERLKALQLLGALPNSTDSEAGRADYWRSLAALPYPSAFLLHKPAGESSGPPRPAQQIHEDWEVLSGEEVERFVELTDSEGLLHRVSGGAPSKRLERRLTEIYTSPDGPHFTPREVVERVFAGRAPLLERDTRALLDLGITHLLDLREDDEWLLPGLLGRAAMGTLEASGVTRESVPIRAGTAPGEDEFLLTSEYLSDLYFVEETSRIYVCSRSGRGRVTAVLVAWWAQTEKVRGRVALLDLRRRGFPAEATPEQLEEAIAFAVSEDGLYEGEGDLEIADQLPWEHVVACFGRNRARRDAGGEALASARARLLPEARACPICGSPTEHLRWFWFESPAESWPALLGTAGWMSACESCKIHVDYWPVMIS